MVVDAGLKSISSEHGVPVVKFPGGLRLRKLNAEHGIIDILDPSVSPDVGDTARDLGALQRRDGQPARAHVWHSQWGS